MASGPCPTSANMDMFGSTSGSSIEANVIGTSGGTSYASFDSLRTSCINSMVNSSYGTQGVDPTESHDFRGYPKPTWTANWEEADNTPTGNRYQELWVDGPTMNNKVGFTVTYTLAVDEYRDDTNGLLGSHNETVTYNAGSSTVSSSSMPYTAGKGYRVSDYAANSTYDIDIEVNLSCNHPSYWSSGSSFYIGVLTYTAGPTAYTHSYEDIDSLSCSGTSTSGSTVCYSPDSTLDSSSTLYTTSAMTTTIPDGQYMLDAEDDTYFAYADVESGNCNSYTECP